MIEADAPSVARVANTPKRSSIRVRGTSQRAVSIVDTLAGSAVQSSTDSQNSRSRPRNSVEISAEPLIPEVNTEPETATATKINLTCSPPSPTIKAERHPQPHAGTASNHSVLYEHFLASTTLNFYAHNSTTPCRSRPFSACYSSALLFGQARAAKVFKNTAVIVGSAKIFGEPETL
jgi:hypothetical protein